MMGIYPISFSANGPFTRSLNRAESDHAAETVNWYLACLIVVHKKQTSTIYIFLLKISQNLVVFFYY